MTHLALSLLGPFQATLDGQPITGFESDKVRALLAYLAIESDRPHRRQALAGLLWSERTERSARQNLSQALFNLRRAIHDSEAEPPFLTVTRQTLQFNRLSDHWLDVEAAQALLDPCEEHPHRHLDMCGKCLDRFSQAVTLCGGSFLEGFSLSDSVAFEEWSLLQREHCHRRLIGVLQRLADCLERRREYGRALQYARHRAELEPWSESAHQQVMRLLALNGRRSAALAQYRLCRRALAEELGAEPKPETVALYERIRDGAVLRPSSPPHNLPAQLTPLVGRETALAQIEAHLRDPVCRLLTLVGPGGIGKTRLALDAAWTQVDAFAHGVFFVSLASLGAVASVVPAVARAIGFAFHGQGEPRQQLLDYLWQKDMLLILDNFEHLLVRPELAQHFAKHSDGHRGAERRRGDSRRARPEPSRRIAEHPESKRGNGAELVVDILRTAPGVKIVVTSRARLNVYGEQLFFVRGMDCPADPDRRGNTERQAPERIARYSAVKLFLQGARRTRPDWAPDGGELAHVGQICRLVAGMPLAIVLAASLAHMLTPAQIAAEIRRNLDALTTDLRGIPDRQHSIRALLDHSWSLLTEREQEVMRKLSVFRGGFTAQAAEAVAGASSQDLVTLAHRSLLRQDRDARYDLAHELLRQYAVEKLARDPTAREAAHDRHCAYYVAALQRWGAELRGSRQQTALAEMDLETENARAAWEWAVTHRQADRLNKTVDGLCRFYQWRGRYVEAEAACQMAAADLRTSTSADGQCALAKTLAWQSDISHQLGRTTPTEPLLRDSIALLNGPLLAGRDTRSERARFLLQLGQRLADPALEKAQELYEQSLALYREIGDELGEADVLAAMGRLAWTSGEYGRAKPLQEAALAIRQRRGNQKEIAYSFTLLGVTTLFQGQLEQGERLIRKGLEIRQQIGDRVGTAIGFENLGGALTFLGKFTEACSLMEESIRIYEDLGFRHASECSMLDVALAHLGHYEQAQRRQQKALAHHRAVSNVGGVGGRLCELGRIALAKEAYVEARDLLQESVTVHRDIEQPHELSRSLAFLGLAERGLGRMEQSHRLLREALLIACRIQAFIPLVTVLPTVSLWLVDRDRVEQAVEVYALVSRYPHVANSRWFEDVVGRHIAAAAALPPDVIAAAQARGRSGDLWDTAARLASELAASLPG
jgi:predicted ATPase/DNA-binding SARP family transcriptional activator